MGGYGATLAHALRCTSGVLLTHIGWVVGLQLAQYRKVVDMCRVLQRTVRARECKLTSSLSLLLAHFVKTEMPGLAPIAA